MTSATLTIAVFNERSGWRLPDAHVERIRDAAGSRIEVLTVESRAELLAALPHTNYLIGFPIGETELSDRASALRWVQLTGSVGDALSALHLALSRGVRVTSAAGIRAPQCAEHVVMLLLALMRRLDVAYGAQSRRRWATADVAPLVRDLEGSVVGLVSISVIGRAIAQRLKAFGVEIVATRAPGVDPREELLCVDEMLPVDALDELLERSDAVIFATPFLPGGLESIGRRELERMKEGAILIDASRGGIVQQSALVDALRSGRVGAAGLDVFEHEPLPEDSPLWSTPNVIITPHVSSSSPRYWERAVDVICHNVQRVRAGKPLLHELTLELLGLESAAAGR